MITIVRLGELIPHQPQQGRAEPSDGRDGILGVGDQVPATIAPNGTYIASLAFMTASELMDCIATLFQACKLFHDGLHIIKKGEESPKFIQDRIPEVAHKYFKKKQWRKQFYEAMRRVCCRLSIGLGFRPNCMAEDAFIHVILGMTFELGWRRIAEFIDILPEWERDRDFSRVLKFGANEEVGNLLRGVDAPPVATSGKAKALSIDPNLKTDVKTGWFKCYDMSSAHLFDHIVRIEEDEADKWSVTTGDTEASGRDRGLSNASLDSVEDLTTTTTGIHHPVGRPRGHSNPSTPSNRKGRAPSLGTLEENVNALLGDD